MVNRCWPATSSSPTRATCSTPCACRLPTPADSCERPPGRGWRRLRREEVMVAVGAVRHRGARPAVLVPPGRARDAGPLPESSLRATPGPREPDEYARVITTSKARLPRPQRLERDIGERGAAPRPRSGSIRCTAGLGSAGSRRQRRSRQLAPRRTRPPPPPPPSRWPRRPRSAPISRASRTAGKSGRCSTARRLAQCHRYRAVDGVGGAGRTRSRPRPPATTSGSCRAIGSIPRDDENLTAKAFRESCVPDEQGTPGLGGGAGRTVDGARRGRSACSPPSCANQPMSTRSSWRSRRSSRRSSRCSSLMRPRP